MPPRTSKDDPTRRYDDLIVEAVLKTRGAEHYVKVTRRELKSCLKIAQSLGHKKRSKLLELSLKRFDLIEREINSAHALLSLTRHKFHRK